MFRFIVLVAFLASATAIQPLLDGRIIGGEVAKITQFPHQLSLQTAGEHICGASIIGSKWAVTSAYCTDGQPVANLTVLAGVSNRVNETGQRIQIKKVHQNPGFDLNTLNQDVSVLELASELTFSDAVKAITLAADGFQPTPGTSVWVSGWGVTWMGGPYAEHLQRLVVQIFDRTMCTEAYGKKFTKYMTCAGVREGRRDACYGDSGGPMVSDNKLIGIISWGYGCGEVGYPAVYASVGALRSYIKKVSGI